MSGNMTEMVPETPTMAASSRRRQTKNPFGFDHPTPTTSAIYLALVQKRLTAKPHSQGRYEAEESQRLHQLAPLGSLDRRAIVRDRLGAVPLRVGRVFVRFLQLLEGSIGNTR